MNPCNSGAVSVTRADLSWLANQLILPSMTAIPIAWTVLLLVTGCGERATPRATTKFDAESNLAQLAATTDSRTLFNELKAKADAGDVTAQNDVGMRFMMGDGVAQNLAKGFTWFLKAAEQGNAQAQFHAGACYQFGDGTSTNLTEAVKWYRKSTDQGNAAAQNALGVSYENAIGVAKDQAEAVNWFRKSAEQGDAEGQHNLGWCYANGAGVPTDHFEAWKWLNRAAAQKSREALRRLNALEIFMSPEQLQMARELDGAQLLAKEGDVIGHYGLGVFYSYGRGVPQDHAEAVKWFRKAADQGFAPAQYSLGSHYARGDGVVKDVSEAVKWWGKAAEQGDAEAQYSLARCYSLGEGVGKDSAQAAKWLHKAADQGLARAQFRLGVSYATGDGEAKDEVAAVKWYRRAAEQDDAKAQFNLGLCYAEGYGVAKDVVEGYKWFLLAAGQGDTVAKTNVGIAERRMLREQIAEGQRLARNFKPSRPPNAQGEGSNTGITAGRPSSTGTAFFITDDGFLITNEHVVKEATQVRLVTSAGVIGAKVVKVDAANDLALLKAEGRFAALPVVASRTMRLGSTVATVGFPNVGLQGFAPKLARGEIAALSGAQDDARYFQISVPVQPGNSGGALVDERGNVVGVVSAKLNARAALVATGALPENVNYAVKSSFLLSFLEAVPEVSAKLKEASTKERKFEDVVKSAEQAAVLVLVY